jgi:hypothetical protein
MSQSLHFTNCIMGAKAQSGMSEEMIARFNNTAQNPVLLNTVGLWLMYFEIPTLPQLPPSATLLKALWPRLQQYSITSNHDALYSTCEAGAKGDEGKAKACMDGWEARVPGYAAQVDAIRKQLWTTFPNEKGARHSRVASLTPARLVLPRDAVAWHVSCHVTSRAVSSATSVSRDGRKANDWFCSSVGVRGCVACWLAGWLAGWLWKMASLTVDHIGTRQTLKIPTSRRATGARRSTRSCCS